MERILIRELRKKAAISQYRLAKLTNVSRFKISQFECGYGDLSEFEIQAILSVLKTSVEQQEGTSK